MADPEDGKVDLEHAYEALKELYGEAMDDNAALMVACRRRAAKAFALAEKAEALADQYREIGALWVDSAQAHSFMLAESLSSEFDTNDVLTIDTADLGEDESDDDE